MQAGGAHFIARVCLGIVGTSILGRKPAKVPSKDGRSADAVLLRRTKAALVAHVGGKPSATQRALIDRAANLTLHVARMDARAMEQGELSDHTSRQYLAWSNSLARTLALLGMDAAKASAPSLRDYLAAKAPAAQAAGRP
jgi:hypothetical protein